MCAVERLEQTIIPDVQSMQTVSVVTESTVFLGCVKIQRGLQSCPWVICRSICRIFLLVSPNIRATPFSFSVFYLSCDSLYLILAEQPAKQEGPKEKELQLCCRKCD